MKILNVVGLFLFVSCCQAHADDPPLATIVEEARQSWSAPGVVAVVVKGERTLLISGFGTRDHEGRKPVTVETVFPIGSCTKAFTSATIASLVHERRLNFDDPVSKHLPSFKLSDPHANAMVTLRDLLSHRTGLNGHDLLWYYAPWSLEESVRRIGELELAGPFRGSFHYSSLTVAAAGLAVARSSGKSWEQLVRTQLVEPLGMKRIAFTSDQFDANPNRAEGFRRTDDDKIVPMPAYRMKEAHPAGSLSMSAAEMETWLRYQLANSTSELAETKRPQTIVPLTPAVKPYHPHGTQVSYGMGWLIYDYRGKLVIAHGGMIDGMRTQFTLLPEEKIGIALCNNLHESKMNLAVTLSMIDHLLDHAKTDWNQYFRNLEREEAEQVRDAMEEVTRQRHADVKPRLPLASYAGTYRNPAYGTGTVAMKSGRLVWSWSSFAVPLEPWEGEIFRMTEGRFKNHFVEFRVGGNGANAVRFADRVFETK
ncbi:MAG: serine hydrolase [Gemmataceae bacterium]